MIPHNNTTNLVDGLAVFVAAASFAGLLPAIAAVFTIVWTGMRIYEMIVGNPFADSRLAKWITGRE